MDQTAASDAAQDRLDEMRTMADRTLLSVMQASLSLIGFGFTIYQIFSDLAARAGVTAPNRSGGRLGLALLSLGLLLLASGLWGHARYSRGMDARRVRLIAQGVLPPSPAPRISSIFVVSALLLAISLTTLGAILFRRFI